MMPENMNEMCKAIVLAWNKHIDDFIKTIPEKLGVDENKLTMADWFRGQELIQEQNFYRDGHAIQMSLIKMGFIVKMDMQSDKLSFYCDNGEVYK